MKIDVLTDAVRAKKNPTALGLDTRLEYLPSKTRRHDGGREWEDALEFNERLLAGLRDIVPCVKLQAACYEAMGAGGAECMSRTLRAARSLGYVTIVDAKRGDIGVSAEAYASAYLEDGAYFEADFLTVNPYFGSDGVSPFVEACRRTGRGIFVLVKTSNPSGAELQDVTLEGGRALYELVGEKVSLWGEGLIGESGYSSVGAVVGATYPAQVSALRRAMPRSFFLIPGYGAQGAAAADIAGAFDASGGGAVVNASRSIILAHQKTGSADFVSAARDEAIRMRDDLRGALGSR